MDASFLKMLRRPAGELRAEALRLTLEEPFAPEEGEADSGAADGETALMGHAHAGPRVLERLATEDAERLVDEVEGVFRRLSAAAQNVDAFWAACCRDVAAFSLSEAVNLRLAVMVWQERNARPLTPNEQWMQTLPARMTPGHQQAIQQTRQAASRKRSPITPEALSQQLARFQKVRGMRSA